MRLASVLLALPLVANALINALQAPRHFSEGWPVHAQHHLLDHITAAIGLSLVSLLLVFGPLRRGERWAWWGLVVAGVLLFGGYWLANATVGLGLPAAVPNASQAIQAALYSVGLGLALQDTSPAAARAAAGSGGD
jgi:hypothetical protein